MWAYLAVTSMIGGLGFGGVGCANYDPLKLWGETWAKRLGLWHLFAQIIAAGAAWALAGFLGLGVVIVGAVAIGMALFAVNGRLLFWLSLPSLPLAVVWSVLLLGEECGPEGCTRLVERIF